MRTPAELFFPEPQQRALEDALRGFGEARLGCGGVSQVWLSYYVDGMRQVRASLAASMPLLSGVGCFCCFAHSAIRHQPASDMYGDLMTARRALWASVRLSQSTLKAEQRRHASRCRARH